MRSEILFYESNTINEIGYSNGLTNKEKTLFQIHIRIKASFFWRIKPPSYFTFPLAELCCTTISES